MFDLSVSSSLAFASLIAAHCFWKSGRCKGITKLPIKYADHAEIDHLTISNACSGASKLCVIGAGSGSSMTTQEFVFELLITCFIEIGVIGLSSALAIKKHLLTNNRHSVHIDVIADKFYKVNRNSLLLFICIYTRST